MFMRLTAANTHRKYDPAVNFRRIANTHSEALPATMLATVPEADTMRLSPLSCNATVEIEIAFTPGTMKDTRP